MPYVNSPDQLEEALLDEKVREKLLSDPAVSYTHLTLPTNREV